MSSRILTTLAMTLTLGACRCNGARDTVDTEETEETAETQETEETAETAETAETEETEDTTETADTGDTDPADTDTGDTDESVPDTNGPLCDENERVEANECVPCLEGSTNEAGDDPAGIDTECDVELCAVNHHVVNHECVACPQGELNPSGDDPTGANTECCDQEPIWGAAAAVGTAEGQFQNAFVTGSLSNTAWTAVSAFESGGATSPGSAYWTRTADGTTQGAYDGGLPPIASLTAANGAAIFDSDFMDNGGDQGAFGTGTSPSPHRGYLVSPPFDLAGHTEVPVSAFAYYYYREFDVTELSMQLSLDNGVTWGTAVSFPLGTSLVNGSRFFNFDADLATPPQGSDLTHSRIRLVFDGDYYFATVDDLTVYTCHSPQ